MPPSRTTKRSAEARAWDPVPRITDPYAPPDEDHPEPETPAEKAAVEKVRAERNHKIVLLGKKLGAPRWHV